AERGLGSRRGIDMDELPVLGRVGEQLDPRLVNVEPARKADLLADSCADVVEAGDRHHCCLQACEYVCNGWRRPPEPLWGAARTREYAYHDLPFLDFRRRSA